MNTPTFEYVLQKKDFINAQRLHLKHNRSAALSYYFWIWLVPILGVVVALFEWTAYLLHNEIMMRTLAPVAGAGLWLAIFLPFMRWWNVRRCWKASSETIDGGKPVTLQFNDELLISTIPGKSEGRFFWTGLIDFAEDDRLALLYIRKKQFLYVPKSALPEEAWVRVRALAPRKK